MQINRLFEILYILLDKKTVTANELAEHFEVSVRTIYRDIDTLSMANIPIYTNKGRGGGISIMDGYVLNKAMLSSKEQMDIISSLQGLSAVHNGDEEKTLAKIGSLFGKKIEAENWIEVDYSRWGDGKEEQQKFETVKNAILNCMKIEFDYFNTDQEKSNRIVCPVRLIFKSQAWYLFAYCTMKKGYRLFKLSRIRNLVSTNQEFDSKLKEEESQLNKPAPEPDITVTMKIGKEMAFRVYDEYSKDQITVLEDGSFCVSQQFPGGPWLVNYVISYQQYAEVIEPEWLKNDVIAVYQKALAIYENK